MSKKIESIKARQAQLAGNMQAITAAAENEGRTLTADEQTSFDGYVAEYDANKAEIGRLERLAEIEAEQAQPVARAVQPIDTVAAPVAPANSAVRGSVVAHNYKNHGFTKGVGEFYLAVRQAGMGGRVDERLAVNAVTTWGGSSVGADGGWALPPEFKTGIMSQVLPEDSFLNALQPLPTNSDVITIPSDEDAPWASTGITAAKTAEGGAITASKPALKQVKVVMYGIKSLVHVEEKSLRDMAFMASYVTRKMGEKIRWKVENYVMNGTGENEPLGILNAPGLLSVTETTSTATVISAVDVMRMKAAALAGGAPGFWVAHPDVLPQVWALKSDATAGFPLYTTDMRLAPGGMLLGSGIYSSEAAKPLDTAGDILFIKPDGYFLAFEAGGPTNDTTIAFAFDQNLQSFRSTLYMGGAPSLSAKVLRADGASYTSNLIALAGSRS